MKDLVLYEFRRILKSPLSWLILAFLTVSLVLSWLNLNSEATRKLRIILDPASAAEDGMKQDKELQDFKQALEDLSSSEAMKMRYRNEISLITKNYEDRLKRQILGRYASIFDNIHHSSAPQDLEKFKELSVMMNEAASVNAEKGYFIYFEYANDFAGYTYSLFRFTQSGFLILAALLLGLMSPELSQSPAVRRAGTSRLLIARILTLTVTGLLLLILPRLLASLAVLLTNGPGQLDMLLPQNPAAGYPLYLMEEGAVIRLSELKAVSAASLTTLGRAFLYMYFYEAAQIFLWAAVGLSAGVLTRRRYLGFAVPVSLLILFKLAAPLLGRFSLPGFLFPIYHDAVRDVIGSPFMATGTFVTDPGARNYILAISVMILSGISAVYLADLKVKRRLFRLSKEAGSNE